MKTMHTVPRDSRWAQIFLVIALVAIAALMMAPQAHARSSYLTQWSSHYPASTSETQAGRNGGCQLCHTTSNGSTNAYGHALRGAFTGTSVNATTINAAFTAVENADSDGNGDSNLVEISANTQPGWTTNPNPTWPTQQTGGNPTGTINYPGTGLVDPPAAGNTPPVANPDTYNTGFNTQLTVNAPGVLGNDTDADNDPLTAVLVTGLPGLSLSANGSFIYMPDAGFSGAVSFTYVANDGTDNSNVATVTINVAGPGNTPPVANDDAYQTPFNTQLNVPAPGVLGNDTDANGDTLTAALQSNPSNGTLNSFSTNGAFSYIPNTGFTGTDSFTYLANDGLANSNLASVTITVLPQVGGDTDGDGIPDTQDNCIVVANTDQRDTDGDGYGNVCDADLNNDDTVNLSDYSLFRAAFGAQPTQTLEQENADFNGDGNVNLSDYSIFRSYFGQVPGPSCCPVVGGELVARPDTYSTPVGKTLAVTASRISGVLHNDTDPQGQTLTTVLVSNTTKGNLNLSPDGSFVYTPNAGVTENQNDHFEYRAVDTDGNQSAITRANIHIESNQSDYKIMMNYELGMHCTGFEFAYCCVLPVYNSILAQVVKPDSTGQGFPELLEGDPNVGKDRLGRETVIRDRARVGNNFKKHVVKYWHDAQPRQEGNGKLQNSTLISAVEGNSLQSWNTTFDSAMVVDGAIRYGSYNGADGVMLGDGDLNDPTDNYQNSVWNHLYFYENLEGGNSTGTSAESDKIRLGVSGQPGPFPAVAYPADCGPAFHPMGPVTQGGDPANPTVPNDCGGFSNGNVLTFSGDTGTVVFTQMKVLENLPIMLTSPRIWEALGLPLTPFEDTIDFFVDPGLVDEDSVRPFVAMKAQLYDYDPAALGGAGAATLNADGTPVIGHGTAPIDIPNCERCHSNPADGTTIANSEAEGGGTLTVVNSPNNDPGQAALVAQEYAFWNAFYGINPAGGDSDWYSRLKSAAISILVGHDVQHGTSFSASYPGCTGPTDPVNDNPCVGEPQLTRLGHEAVICSRCHAQNVIAAVKSATLGGGVIMPISEAIHNNHSNVAAGGNVVFGDAQGRDGGCQGCHPSHRSDGNMNGYPITLAGANRNAFGDNRDASGGCFVGRDVHSNPGKDSDGAETPEHLNAVGQWLSTNVFSDTAADGSELGIWCTNCHNQLGQEMWKAENMSDLIHGVGANNPRAEPTLAAVAAAVGTTEAQAMSWLDPKNSADTYAIWASDPGLCDYVFSLAGGQPFNPAQDGNVAVVEVLIGGSGSGGSCSNAANPNAFTVPVDCGFVNFDICGSTDVDGDFNVNLVGNTVPDAGGFGGAFCTTPDCVASAQASLGSCTLAAGDKCAVPVPFSAATDGRDHWLSAGEAHCADCHAAPYTEQSGNIDAFPPFNYPRKASLMRYSRGHQDITCQGCHESIHGLYPVTPSIDNTSYAQAAALNHDGSHGPLKCGACHAVGANGIPTFLNTGNGNVYGITDFDSAVTWAHTYTDEASVLDTTCQNCHGDRRNSMGSYTNANGTYARHAQNGRGSRQMMDRAEIERWGAVLTSTDGSDGVCLECHGNRSNGVSCSNNAWLDHLTLGRVAAEVFEKISVSLTPGANSCW